ncbi:MAG: hypothetical protein AAF125_05270, partial [Chloroflexota bacterium]
MDFYENIPFYLNGTLSDEARLAFERALANDPELQAEVQQWRVLAQAVVDDVAPHTTHLPPIAPTVRASLVPHDGNLIPMPPARETPTEPERAKTPKPVETAPRAERRTRRLPLTMAAAVAVMIFVGVLLFALNRPDGEDGQAIALVGTPIETSDESGGPGVIITTGATVTVMPTSNMPPTETPQPTWTIPPPPTDDPAGVSVAPIVIPTNTIDVPPPSVISPAAIENAESMSAMSGGEPCFVYNEGPEVNVYQAANTGSNVIGLLMQGERLSTRVQTGLDVGTAFYEVFLPNGSIRLGWVVANTVRLEGPGGPDSPCVSLLEPT